MTDRVDVTCPCCTTRLTVDCATGEILAEERPTADQAKNFDTAMTQVRSGEQRRAAAFDKAFDRTKQLDTLLDKKFEEARKKAAADPSGKPKSPFDLD